MTIDDLILQHGSQAALARYLGVTPAAVCQWARAGRLPQGRVWQLQLLGQGQAGAAADAADRGSTEGLDTAEQVG